MFLINEYVEIHDLLFCFSFFTVVSNWVSRIVEFHWYWYRLLNVWYRNIPSPDQTWEFPRCSSTLYHAEDSPSLCCSSYWPLDPPSDGVQASFLCQTLERPAPLRDLSPDQDMNCPHAMPTRPMKDPGQAYCHGGVALCETLKQQTTDDFPVMPIGQLQEQGGGQELSCYFSSRNV